MPLFSACLFPRLWLLGRQQRCARRRVHARASEKIQSRAAVWSENGVDFLCFIVLPPFAALSVLTRLPFHIWSFGHLMPSLWCLFLLGLYLVLPPWLQTRTDCPTSARMASKTPGVQQRRRRQERAQQQQQRIAHTSRKAASMKPRTRLNRWVRACWHPRASAPPRMRSRRESALQNRRWGLGTRRRWGPCPHLLHTLHPRRYLLPPLCLCRTYRGSHALCNRG